MATSIRKVLSGSARITTTVAAGLFLLICIFSLVGCSGSSSDSRSAAKKATSGPYEIFVTINSPNDGDTVLFSTDGASDPTTDVEFSAFAKGGTGTLTYTWTIQGPTVTSTASGQDLAQITFYETGPHKLTVTVKDENGVTGSDSITVFIRLIVI